MRKKSPEEITQQQQQARPQPRPALAPGAPGAPGGAKAAGAAKAAGGNGAAYAGVGRNQPCPCGSGKKYKHCHGKKGG